MKKRSFLTPLLLAVALPCVSNFAAQPKKPASRAIARIWRGRTLAAKADEYQAYLDTSGISKVRATPGNLGVTVLRRNDSGKTEFLVMSLWEVSRRSRRGDLRVAADGVGAVGLFEGVGLLFGE
jgi:heme-degrading monooxygenase HmoA